MACFTLSQKHDNTVTENDGTVNIYIYIQFSTMGYTSLAHYHTRFTSNIV